MKLIIASNNAGKIREFKQLLTPLGYEVMSQSEAGISIDVEETGNTFEENALLKAKAIFAEFAKLAELGKNNDYAVIADDSGLEIDGLGGEPGVFSARYAPEGQRKATVLQKLKNVPKEDRTARFVCCICYIKSEEMPCVSDDLISPDCFGCLPLADEKQGHFEAEKSRAALPRGARLFCRSNIDSVYLRKVRGECEGFIGFDCRGENGFGYDPIFMPIEYKGKKSFAELTDVQKNEISHRGRALAKLVELLV